MTNNRRSRYIVVTVILALIAVAATLAAVLTAHRDAPEPTQVTLSEALDKVAAGDVSKAVVDDAAGELELTLRQTAGGATWETNFPRTFGSEVTEKLLAAHVDIDAEPSRGTNVWADLLLRLVPVLFIVGFLIWFAKTQSPTAKMNGAGETGSESKPPSTRFDDVAGVDEAKEQLQEIVAYLREPDLFDRYGAKAPRGALLAGPPGTGKTLLARAVAGEAGVPFFAVSGADFTEMFVGVGARRVRNVFKKARAAGKAIVFIDEIDAMGRARSGGPGSGADNERDSTLVSLLTELDGFNESHVVVLAATNRPDILDPALTRPGRLDRKVEVPNPDRRGRERILRVHATSRPIGDDVDFTRVARQTPGMSGADLAQLVNEACMEAARRRLETVTAACFQAAIETVAMGRARVSAVVTDSDRAITAFHEAGHTIAALLLPDADDPVSVTIIPRGQAGGVTWMSGSDDLFLTRRKAEAKLTVALAGRAAEEVLLDGEYTQGASSDLGSATRLATAMVTKYAMTSFGYTQVSDEQLAAGGAIADRAHSHVEDLLRSAHMRAAELVRGHEPLLRAVADALLEEDTLSGEQVREIASAIG